MIVEDTASQRSGIIKTRYDWKDIIFGVHGSAETLARRGGITK